MDLLQCFEKARPDKHTCVSTCSIYLLALVALSKGKNFTEPFIQLFATREFSDFTRVNYDLGNQPRRLRPLILDFKCAYIRY